MCYTCRVSRKKEGRKSVHVWLKDDLVRNIDSRIGEIGADRTAVVELILETYWDRPIVQIRDRKPAS
jgi:hypothetical protein